MFQDLKGVNQVQIGESTSGIKEVKEMVEGLARQIASLSTAKSTEPHDHDYTQIKPMP